MPEARLALKLKLMLQYSGMISLMLFLVVTTVGMHTISLSLLPFFHLSVLLILTAQLFMIHAIDVEWHCCESEEKVSYELIIS